MQRARDLGLARLISEKAPREHVVLAVRTESLRGEPLAAPREVVDRDLAVPVPDRGAAICGEQLHPSEVLPGPRLLRGKVTGGDSRIG